MLASFAPPFLLDLRIMKRGSLLKRLILMIACQGSLITGIDPTFATASDRSCSASSSASRVNPAGAMDGNRFSTATQSLWRGKVNQPSWWWQVEFHQPRSIGAILQIFGDHPRNFRNAPRDYLWQFRQESGVWSDLPQTRIENEHRLYRIHRLPEAIRTGALRLQILSCDGKYPSLREVEFFSEPTAEICFEDWYLSISSRETCELSTTPCEFARLIQQCEDWKHLRTQYVWHGDVHESFVAAEPRPLCAFLSGSFLEWCQRSREPWRGVQEVLRQRHLPMWGACGGAQILAILDETGVDQAWDCPRCRDPSKPLLPIYSHIGHTGPGTCGEYDHCIGERGKFTMQITARDPVLAGLPITFDIMESHIGQIAYVPTGWIRLVTKGPGAHTVNQCLRVRDRYIYAAQFHIELPGTPENSRQIMSNFLSLAKQWGGYNPDGLPVPPPGSVDLEPPKSASPILNPEASPAEPPQ
jgi:hypothetical protein